MSSFVCFGEVLWDAFPEGERIGGAPLNVALRLTSFGNDVQIISAIGHDARGEGILNYLSDAGLSLDGIQKNDRLETGVVQVSLDSEGVATYTIKHPVAWDSIEDTDEALKLSGASGVFVYGSLAARSETTYTTLKACLKKAGYKVFDVNLRPPFYSVAKIEELMQPADFVKCNDDELEELIMQPQALSSFREGMEYLSGQFNVPTICVTRGGEGALLLRDGVFYENKGYIVEVDDTVGAGDSFLGTLLHELHSGRDEQGALDRACAVGAIVASKPGANPSVSEDEIKDLMTNRSR